MSVMPADCGLNPGDYKVIYASDSGGLSEGTMIRPIYLISIKKSISYLPKLWWTKTKVAVEIKP
ncbi:MAG: hypothetical protein ACP5QG_02425 [candidate division WOR-3 bacterium]